MNFIACNRHPKQNIQFIYLLPHETEFLCENCVEDSDTQGELLKVNKLISINTLLQKPEMIMKKLDLDYELQNIYKNIGNYNSASIDEQIKEIKLQAQIMQNQIQEILKNFFNCIQNIVFLRKQFEQNLIQELHFESLKQLLMGLVQSKEATNPDAINQLKLRLHQYFQQLIKHNSGYDDNNSILTKIYQTSNSIDQEIQKLQPIDELKAKLEQFQNDQYKIATQVFPQIIKPISSILAKDYQVKIINLVKERQKRQIQDMKIIFLGSRDGLNNKSFWSKVNGKKNLLMVFKSESNYIFGGYSPCEWQQNLSDYVQDNTNSSFLFSQTHDEVYPIVSSQYVIYCNSGYGPTFGGGFDLYIGANFQNGYSNLGNSYKQGNKFQGQYKTELFGQQTPNIIECQIFEIQFK